MFEFLMNPAIIVFNASLYGVTMKIADLLDEHGLKWFKGSDILFGLFWGFFGALLVLSDNVIANVMLAMNLAFIIRHRLDYLNHQIASTIIILTFLISSTVNVSIFLVFYFLFLIFGYLKDYVDDILKMKKGIFVSLNEAMLYYPIPTLTYAVFFGHWILFYAFLSYTISYDLTKHYAKLKGYP